MNVVRKLVQRRGRSDRTMRTPEALAAAGLIETQDTDNARAAAETLPIAIPPPWRG